MPTTLCILLDTRRIKKSMKYPIKLRVTFERISEYYQTVFELSKEEYDKLRASRVSNELQSIRDKLKEIERISENTIAELSPFSFTDFEKNFIRNNIFFQQRKLKLEAPFETKNEFDYSPFHKKFPMLLEVQKKPGSISLSYLKVIKKLLIEGRISTSLNYHSSYVSLKKFRGDVCFSEITVSYLNEYEAWAKCKNISKTTIGMYLRPLRSIFNEAIEEGIIKREKCYPFGRRRYCIPASKNTKKALDLDDVKKIYYYKSDPYLESEQRAKDYWLFSYFGNGMNAKDIACLKNKNIKDNYIIFERSKTERALRGDPKPISVYLTDDMKLIIEKWGNKDKSPDNFIFPVLEAGIMPLRQYELVQLFISFINNWMKLILKNLGIDKKATTYVARHTFSTILKLSGASTEYIQEALGHSDVKTTENYLDSFGNDTKREFAQRLTSFKD